MLAALMLWALDVATWPSVRRPWPLLVSALLSVANGAATGGAAIVVVWLPARSLARARIPWGYVAALVIAVPLTAMAAGQAVVSLNATSTMLLVVSCVSAVVVLTLAFGLASVARTIAHEKARPSWGAAAALLILATGLIVLDRTVLSSVVEKTYSFVEGIAHLALMLACTGIFGSVQRSRRSRERSIVNVLAAGASLWLVVFGCSSLLRWAVERSLPAVWEEPVYAARWLRRVRRVESLGSAQSELQRLVAKYHLTPPSVPDAASSGVGLSAGPPPPDEIERPPPPNRIERPWNIVVFFVDTLRADVARDPSVMPETIDWMQANFSFSRAYASGSSTLLTLAPLLGCRYDTSPNDRPRLLDAARAAGMTTGLVIPKSAFDYHRGAFPAFRFDHETVVADYVDGRRLPVASEVVDRSIDWLRERPTDRFFLWLYHFDVHSWGDLDESYVEAHAKEAGFSKTDGLHWRYRAAARGVDRSFTRFRSALEELGLADRTVVIFLSDHGEGLGQRNFWMHSTYLWESLIRVPISIHVPGQEGRRSDVPVSTVDIAPTLMPFIGSPAPDAECHGAPLLSAGEVQRPFPIFFSAMTDGYVARVGLLHGTDRKLVVDLRDSDARLLRITDGCALEEDVSFEESNELTHRLTELVRAPIYPRHAQ